MSPRSAESFDAARRWLEAAIARLRAAAATPAAPRPRRVLGELREREIGRAYREAYSRHPDDPATGEAGAQLLAEAIRVEESARGRFWVI